MTIEDIEKFMPMSKMADSEKMNPDPRSDDVIGLEFNDAGIVCKMKDGSSRQMVIIDDLSPENVERNANIEKAKYVASCIFRTENDRELLWLRLKSEQRKIILRMVEDLEAHSRSAKEILAMMCSDLGKTL